jgi:hypothetical protein
LPNPVIQLVHIGRWLTGIETDGRFDGSFTEYPEFNGIDRAYGCALPAERALVLVPQDLPGQILYAES